MAADPPASWRGVDSRSRPTTETGPELGSATTAQTAPSSGSATAMVSRVRLTSALPAMPATSPSGCSTVAGSIGAREPLLRLTAEHRPAVLDDVEVGAELGEQAPVHLADRLVDAAEVAVGVAGDPDPAVVELGVVAACSRRPRPRGRPRVPPARTRARDEAMVVCRPRRARRTRAALNERTPSRPTSPLPVFVPRVRLPRSPRGCRREPPQQGSSGPLADQISLWTYPRVRFPKTGTSLGTREENARVDVRYAPGRGSCSRAGGRLLLGASRRRRRPRLVDQLWDVLEQPDAAEAALATVRRHAPGTGVGVARRGAPAST